MSARNWQLIITAAIVVILIAVLFILSKTNTKLGQKIANFFKNNKSEIKKVVWMPKNDLVKSTCIVLLGLLPLGMNTIYIPTTGVVHDLMVYAIWLFYLLALLLTDWLVKRTTDSTKASTVKMVRYTGALCMVLVAVLLLNLLLWSLNVIPAGPSSIVSKVITCVVSFLAGRIFEKNKQTI